MLTEKEAKFLGARTLDFSKLEKAGFCLVDDHYARRTIIDDCFYVDITITKDGKIDIDVRDIYHSWEMNACRTENSDGLSEDLRHLRKEYRHLIQSFRDTCFN